MSSKNYVAAALIGSALISSVAMAQDTSAKRVGDWRASKLVGVNVYNDANDKIGDISDVILDRSGKVADVVLGVGGFLGMGEHYVAVSFDKLKWSDQPVGNTSASARPATNVDSTSRTAADGTRTTTTTTTGSATTTTASGSKVNWYPDHATLNATKDQLKAMPEFKY